jgi:hypothetical protein
MFCCGLAGLHVRRNDDVAICLSILSVEARRYPLAGENESTNPPPLPTESGQDRIFRDRGFVKKKTFCPCFVNRHE